MKAAAAAGRVSLVGAGPGDPGLITVRGMNVLQRADVVVYDRLVHPALLRCARDDADLLFAGKSAQAHALTQAEINQLLVERARAGQTVCRLKGGDPFVFGRGGEEATALREAGIEFEVVPGVTSAVAVPAYAGIPVTCRGMVRGVGIFTGHGQDDDETSAPAGVPPPGALETLVYLMSVERLPEVTRGLLAAGWDAAMPCAVIESGTLPRQRTLTGTLEGITGAARAAEIQPPAIFLVGEVVRLRDALRWFDNRPLTGKRVVVTRAQEQSGELAARCAELGAEVIEFPVIRIVPIPGPDLPPADRPYDWMLFTSANAARCLADALRAAGRDARALPAARVSAIGPATAAAVERAGLRVDWTAAESTAEGFLKEFPDDPVGKRFLLFRARQGREALPETLTRRGGSVDIVPLYDTQPDEAAADNVRVELAERAADAVLFCSPSAVRAFQAALPETLGPAKIVCIGPVTAAAAREAGLPVAAVAERQSDAGMVEALSAAFAA